MHADSQTGVLKRKPNRIYGVPIGASAGHHSEEMPPAAPRKATEEDAGPARQDTTAADSDAGMTRMPEPPAPPALEQRGVCGDRPGYVEPRSGHCYIPIADSLTWYRARDLCMQRKSHLASITDALEQSFIERLPRVGPTWIGLSRFGTVSFKWITDEPAGFEAWAQDEPSARSEGAVVLREEDGRWADAPPAEMHRGLCEREPSE